MPLPLFSDAAFIPASFEMLDPSLREALIQIGADSQKPPVFSFKQAVASGRLDLASQLLSSLDAQSLNLGASWAIEGCDDHALLLIIRHAARADRFYQKPFFQSALFSAVYYDRASAASLILSEMQGFSLSPPNKNHRLGILDLAAGRGACALLSLILSSKSIATQQDLGSALISAAETGKAGCAAILLPLLDKLPGSLGPTLSEFALNTAAIRGHPDFVQVLLDACPSREACSRALVSASRRGHPACVELLLPFADPSFEGSSAIVEAIDNDCCQCLALLLPMFEPGAPGVASSFSSLASFARRAGSMRSAGIIEAFAEGKAIADGLSESTSTPTPKVPRL